MSQEGWDLASGTPLTLVCGRCATRSRSSLPPARSHQTLKRFRNTPEAIRTEHGLARTWPRSSCAIGPIASRESSRPDCRRFAGCSIQTWMPPTGGIRRQRVSTRCWSVTRASRPSHCIALPMFCMALTLHWWRGSCHDPRPCEHRQKRSDWWQCLADHQRSA